MSGARIYCARQWRYWFVSHFSGFSYSCINKIHFINTLNWKYWKWLHFVSHLLFSHHIFLNPQFSTLEDLLELLSVSTWLLVSVRGYKWVKLFPYLGLKHNIHIRPIEKKSLLIKEHHLPSLKYSCSSVFEVVYTVMDYHKWIYSCHVHLSDKRSIMNFSRF